MRRALAVLSVLLLLSACGPPPKPPGTDGDLVNGWAMLPAAALVVPVAPACFELPAGAAAAEVTRWPDPVDCTGPHQVELVSVGQFAGADADRGTPPASGGAGLKAAHAKCSADANALLGADWRLGRLALSVDLPTPSQWDAGARWYRCDLQALEDLDRFSPVTRSGSLRGALRPGGELLIGCVSVTQPAGGKAGEIDRIRPARCDQPHEAEFAGLFEPPDGPYPPDPGTRRDLNLAGCRPVVARFAGVPDDANFRSRTGLITMPFDKAAWELGNRAVRCLVWPPKPVATSLKGGGTKALPITTA
ncbi:septum formation family protein [Dactylosporangium sp. AC04546]|uniref:septum formation family protein n=1 Tax=Dactylosporangium sp. AC04546 TaxID=2862460 RepID=UPI001EDEA01D|nr:septum formation family protein [Dactylosporangium sp. AC04546]WVK84102.1 septum formation family protein [Dactylosporangium sp. AC04546]